MALENLPPRKIVRFFIVGTANTAIDFFVFGFLVSFGLASVLANVFAWMTAVCFSYLVNSSWSFDRNRSHRDAFPRFVASGALVSLFVSTVAVGYFGPLAGVWPAKIVGTVAGAVLNFFAARWAIERWLGR
jgi:putative flippase GtrA